MVDLHTEVSHALALACEAPHGRHAQLLIHDGPLRQSVIALRVEAQEDSVFLLTTITSQEFGGSHGAPSVDN
jgi:hypothetical protein